MIGVVQGAVLLLLNVLAFGLQVWALVDCARTAPEAFVRAGKRTKGFWLAVTAVCAAVGFVALPPPIGLSLAPWFLTIAAVVGAIVYLADVRPAVGPYRRSRGRPRGW